MHQAKRSDRSENSAPRHRQECCAVRGTFARPAIADSLRLRNPERGGIAAVFAAYARQHQNREPHRYKSDGGLGRNCGWQSDRKYFAALAALWPERREINLGRIAIRSSVPTLHRIYSD